MVILLESIPTTLHCIFYQRWSRGHKARSQGQGHKKKSEAKAKDSPTEDRHSRGQGQECSRPRTGMLEAKAKGQGHKRKCSQNKNKKRSSEKIFTRSPEKNVFQKIFQALYKLLTTQEIVLSSNQGQGNFRGLEASRPRPKTSKCVLEDSNSVFYYTTVNLSFFHTAWMQRILLNR